MFVGVNNDSEELPPNTAVSPFCLAHPGTLPVANEQAIKWSAMTAMALNCEVPEVSKFDRKHYFYPDLPKGYQISQFDQPIGVNGKLKLTLEDGSQVDIRVNRLHLEEDAAKNTHSDQGTFVDYNRAGTPLMEIVSEPDITGPEEAKAYLQEIRSIVRYLGVSDANMDKGNMRCDVNISLRPRDLEDKRLFPKTEIKNVNSFRAVERSIKYEIARQTELWDEGNPPEITITRGWNDTLQKTEAQREKEDAADYHYFPEPDIPPMRFGYNIDEAQKEAGVIDLRLLEAELPELPGKKRDRFMQEYGISAVDVNELISEPKLAGYLENIISELESWAKDEKIDWDKNKSKLIKSASGWLTSKLMKILVDEEKSIEDTKADAENFAELITMLHKGEINSSIGQKVLLEMHKTGGDPSNIVETKGWGQVNDEGALQEVITKVIAANVGPVADYKSGKENALQFLLGQVMKETQGKANPQSVMELLKKELS
jgi:aspartyl-tRNA(Asn)/glutamyl-tRNA(Gln) amidotransferase subunit B